MNRFRVIAFEGGTIRAGRIRLSDSQAQSRIHAIKKVMDGLYEVLDPINFKKGETFEIDFEKAFLGSAFELIEPEPVLEFYLDPELNTEKEGLVIDPVPVNEITIEPEIIKPKPSRGRSRKRR